MKPFVTILVLAVLTTTAQARACVERTPGLAITPGTEVAAIGEQVPFEVRLINHDAPSCNFTRTFFVAANVAPNDSDIWLNGTTFPYQTFMLGPGEKERFGAIVVTDQGSQLGSHAVCIQVSEYDEGGGTLLAEDCSLLTLIP